MKPRSFFFIVFAISNASLVLYGILVLTYPESLLEPFSRYVYQYPAGAIAAIAYIEALFRLLGFFNLIPGLVSLILLYRLHVSWEPWISRTVIGSTVFAYLGPIVFDNTVGHIGSIELVEHILFALIIILGILMWKVRNDER